MTKLKWIPLVAITVLLGCPPPPEDGGGGGGGGAGGEGILQCGGDFGASAEAQKVEAFLTASREFAQAASRLKGSLVDSCKQIGAQLGVPAADMEPQGDVPAVRAACQPVADKIRSELTELRGGAELRIEVVAVPPRCEIDVDAYAGCVAECQVDIDPGEVDVQCEGGYIYGQCSAECTGQCAVEIEGQCRGECEGTCSGGCTGTCQGVCEGTCATRGADGQCNGRCDGTCRGTCSAGCRGSCEGNCWVSGQASCSGHCRGGCSVDYEAPRCTGTVRPPSVDAECHASCDARLRAEVSCQRGQVYVNVTGTVSPDLQARVDRLKNALQTLLPAIQETAKRLRALGEAGGRIVETGRAMREAQAVRTLGARAIACVSQAYLQLPAISVEVTVSIEVSASVSGSVSG